METHIFDLLKHGKKVTLNSWKSHEYIWYHNGQIVDQDNNTSDLIFLIHASDWKEWEEEEKVSNEIKVNVIAVTDYRLNKIEDRLNKTENLLQK